MSWPVALLAAAISRSFVFVPRTRRSDGAVPRATKDSKLPHITNALPFAARPRRNHVSHRPAA